MIRVGVDAWNLPGDHRGIGRYVRSILRAWRSEFSSRIAVDLIVPEWCTWAVRSRYRREVDGAPYRTLSRALHGRAKLDALWFPWNGCSWTAFRAPAVATLHDASNFVLPGYAEQTQTIFRAAVQRCDALITDSMFSAGELARELAIPVERLSVIPLGVDPPAVHLPLDPRVEALRPYILFVGRTERRKGIDALLAAFERVRAQLPQMKLVLAGPRGDGLSDPLAQGTVERGFVDDAELQALYAHADLFAFPSTYEGFGLPVIEAMSHGLPVVAARATAIPEVAGDAAALVGPGNVPELADAMLRVLTDPAYAETLRRRGKQRAAAFTWTRTAEMTLRVLEEVAARG